MGLFDVFRTSDDIEIRAAQDRYNKSIAFRSRFKSAWRSRASSEIKFAFPDVILLMTDTSRYFLGYSRKSECFMAGIFADEFYPDIDRIENSNAPRFHAACDRFELQHALFVEHPEGLGVDAVFRPDAKITALRADGFRYRVVPSAVVNGVTIEKNGIAIAHSSTAELKPSGYTTTALYRSVIGNPDVSTGEISLITVRLREITPGSWTTILYELPYSDTKRARHGINAHYLQQTIEPLGRFLTAIEPCLAKSPVDDDNFDWDSLPGSGS